MTIDRRTTPPTVTLAVDDRRADAASPSVNIDVTGPATTDVPRGTDAIAQSEARLGPSRRREVPAAGVDRGQGRRRWRRSPRAPTRRRRSRTARRHRSRALCGATWRSSSRADPPFRFGIARDHRACRDTPESLVRNFSTIKRGDAVRRAGAPALRPATQRVRLLRQRAGGDRHRHDAPGRRDRSRWRSSRRRRSGSKAGVGYSTDVQFRGNATYRDVDINGQRPADADRGAPRDRSCSRRRCASRSRRTTPAGSAPTAPAPSAPTSRASSRAPPPSARAGTRSRSATSARCRRRSTSTSSSPRARNGCARTRPISSTSGTGAAPTT